MRQRFSPAARLHPVSSPPQLMRHNIVRNKPTTIIATTTTTGRTLIPSTLVITCSTHNRRVDRNRGPSNRTWASVSCAILRDIVQEDVHNFKGFNNKGTHQTQIRSSNGNREQMLQSTHHTLQRIGSWTLEQHIT